MVQLREVIKYIPGVGNVHILYDVVTGLEVFQGTKDEVIAYLQETLDTIIETVTEGFGDIADALTGFGSDIGAGLLDLFRGAGIAVLESVSDVYDYTVDKVGGKKVQLVSSLTILVIAGFTASYILARLPSSGGDSE